MVLFKHGLMLKDSLSSFVAIKLVTPDEIAGAVPGKDYFVSMDFMLIGCAARSWSDDRN